MNHHPPDPSPDPAATDVLYPRSVADVMAAVRAARASGRALYPVSTGLNWGYGAAGAPVAGCTLMNLSAMRAIRNAADISPDNPVALIEPGVTQGQLQAWLAAHCPELTFNVTGSARETSILGNALDRGVGYYGPRCQDIFSLEVVTGAGELLHTGFRRLGERSALANCHPFGLGPQLDGLFSQSNFGVVTSACLRLVPRRPREVAVSMSLRDASRLSEFIDVLARVKRDGLIDSVTHVGNRARTRSTLMRGAVQYLQQRCAASSERAMAEAGVALSLMAPHEWTSLGAVRGSRAQVRAVLAELRSRVGPLAAVQVVTQRRLDLAFAAADGLRWLPWFRRRAAVLAAVRPLHGLCLGVPSDVAIDNLLWQFDAPHLRAVDFESSQCGLIYINPALPMDGRFVSNVLGALDRVAGEHGHVLYVTVNIETATSLVAVINLLFNKGDAGAAARARQCADAMHAWIQAQGLEVYRAGVDMMDAVTSLTPDHWRLVRELKRTLDPDNIISPGRYNLP